MRSEREREGEGSKEKETVKRDRRGLLARVCGAGLVYWWEADDQQDL